MNDDDYYILYFGDKQHIINLKEINLYYLLQKKYLKDFGYLYN